MDGPNASQRPPALPRRQADRARPEEYRAAPVELGTEIPEPPEPAVPSTIPSPPGLVKRPSLDLLARVRDGLQVLDAPAGRSTQNPAPAMWKGMWQ